MDRGKEGGGKRQMIVTKSLFTVKLKTLSVLLLLLNPVRYSRVVGGSLSTDRSDYWNELIQRLHDNCI